MPVPCGKNTKYLRNSKTFAQFFFKNPFAVIRLVRFAEFIRMIKSVLNVTGTKYKYNVHAPRAAKNKTKNQ